GFDLARSELSERASGRSQPNRGGILEAVEAAVLRVPVPGLHRAVFFGDRRDRETVAGARIFASKALIIGEDHAVVARVELRTLGIFDSAVGPERCTLGGTRDFER